MTKVPIKECIRFGWDKFWERPWFFIGAYIIIGIFETGSQYSSKDTDPNFSLGLTLLLVVIAVALAVLRIIIQMGEKRLLLNAHEDVNSASISNLWTPHPFWQFVGTNVLYGLIVFGGLILLIVPGIILGLRYMFAGLIVIDRGLMPMEALRESKRITEGHKWQLLLFGLAIIGINILGFICFFVGLLVSGPVSALAMVHVYRLLEREASEITPVSA